MHITVIHTKNIMSKELIKFQEIFQNYILGGTIKKVIYKKDLPIFYLDNETYFTIEAFVSGADYDEFVSVFGGNGAHRFSAGGYTMAQPSLTASFPDTGSSYKTQLIEEMFEETHFQKLISCTITRATVTNMSISIELDNKQLLACHAYDYLKHKKSLYALQQIQ